MKNKRTNKSASGRSGERGAALVTMLLISLLLLTAGGALIMTTSMTATNAGESSAEAEAYYAAEAGAQSVLNVMRGNVPPNPLFVSNPMGGVADANKMTFSGAVTSSTSNLSGDANPSRLSRWLSYDATYTDRVVLTNSYNPMSGMAYKPSLTDPDNSSVVTFSTSGTFTNYGTASHAFGSGNTRATVTYQPQATATITTSGTSTFGSFAISGVGPGGYTLSNEPFNLVINQTAPFPATVTVPCTLSGNISSTTSLISVSFPTQSNNVLGVSYARSSNPVNSNGTTSIPVTITAPQPNRILVRITGYGPRSAQKQMQMILSRFAFDIVSTSTITLRSADDNTVLTFSQGNSAVYTYSGYDNAGGQNLSAFGVTSTPDYNYLTGLSLPGNQVVGSPGPIQQVPIPSLPTWLQTADNARVFVDNLRTQAVNTNHYFIASSPPSSFGTTTAPVFTFVEGDCVLPPAGGAGLLVVTGKYIPDGRANFAGLILVLGGGEFDRSGGGNGNSLGSVFVARFGPSGDFLAPIFNSSGSGNSSIQYDSVWASQGLASTGPRVLAVGEF